MLLELALDDPAFLLDHEELLFSTREPERIAAREGPDHPDLVDVDPKRPAAALVQPQKA